MINFKSTGELWHAFSSHPLFFPLSLSLFSLCPFLSSVASVHIHAQFKTCIMVLLEAEIFRHTDCTAMQTSAPGCKKCLIVLRSPCPLSKAYQSSHIRCFTYRFGMKRGQHLYFCQLPMALVNFHWILHHLSAFAYYFDFPPLFTPSYLDCPNPFTHIPK